MEKPDPNKKVDNTKNNDGRNSNGSSHISLSSDDNPNDHPDYTSNNPSNNNKSIVPFKPNLPSNSEKQNHNTTTVRIDKFVVEKVDDRGLEERTSISKRTSVVALVIRVFAVIACLISFSVIAADTTHGWTGDSFHRYIQYRYCLAVNVIGFVYSGFQVVDLGCHLGRGNHIISHDLRYHFDFIMDQILAYLVMSASSSAATRVDDWISNWGNDKFTIMASASVAMSFLAFISFAWSSVISGYNLSTRIQLYHS